MTSIEQKTTLLPVAARLKNEQPMTLVRCVIADCTNYDLVAGRNKVKKYTNRFCGWEKVFDKTFQCYTGKLQVNSLVKK
jgi:hypothetical protein